MRRKRASTSKPTRIILPAQAPSSTSTRQRGNRLSVASTPSTGGWCAAQRRQRSGFPNRPLQVPTTRRPNLSTRLAAIKPALGPKVRAEPRFQPDKAPQRIHAA
ncbi:MAG: hypothetical protein GY822_29640 [Deltaproteobacteria bacterium]|nr:hypothetical protein [Deltaproteobacteria bacterium]